MKCLIVDDAAFMRMTLKQAIQTCGFDEILEAGDGVEGLAAYKKDRPDLVIMDITMPEMDGLTAIKHIIAFDPDAKIIVCSSIGQKEIIMETIQAGAKDFLVKPFETEKVAEVVKAIVG